MGLERLISEDSRKPIQKLRRRQLWDIAKAYNLDFPAGAAATTMVSIIETAGIDVTRPLPDGNALVKPVEVQDETGRQKVEYFPVEKPHATQGKNIDHYAIIEAKAKATEKSDEVEALKQKLAEYEKEETDPTKMKMQQLRSQAKAKGINTYGMSKQAIIEALSNGEDAA